ncbi:MAG: hypothetical protein EA427_06930 [Spirochaetaceae bacterium]|nr:MAG: hypothetical protein EA427_06930 [Spirochaetaceae bacterium]
MKRKNILVPAIVLLLFISGCDITLNESHRKGNSSVPLQLEEREWRLVFLFLDENDLEDVADADIRALAAWPDALGRTHRVILRAGTWDGKSLETAAQGSLQRPEIPDLPMGSLLQGSTVSDALRIIDREFPARKQALFIAGHGRGWRGLGYSRSDPSLYLSAEELREVAQAAPATYNLLVLDAGWSAFAEVLVELAGTPVDLVAAETNLARWGIDYAGLLDALDGGTWSARTMREAAGEAVMRAGGGAPAVQLSREQLSVLPAYLESLAVAGSGFLETEPAREALREHVMNRAAAATTPGDAHLRAGDLAEMLSGITPPPENRAFESVLLHLVTVDELGLPAGHATTYRAGQEHREGPRFFRDLSWAPDFFQRSGFLFDLWYREY